jgi:hypothetical protein
MESGEYISIWVGMTRAVADILLVPWNQTQVTNRGRRGASPPVSNPKNDPGEPSRARRDEWGYRVRYRHVVQAGRMPLVPRSD